VACELVDCRPGRKGLVARPPRRGAGDGPLRRRGKGRAPAPQAVPGGPASGPGAPCRAGHVHRALRRARAPSPGPRAPGPGGGRASPPPRPGTRAERARVRPGRGPRGPGRGPARGVQAGPVWP